MWYIKPIGNSIHGPFYRNLRDFLSQNHQVMIWSIWVTLSVFASCVLVSVRFVCCFSLVTYLIESPLEKVWLKVLVTYRTWIADDRVSSQIYKMSWNQHQAREESQGVAQVQTECASWMLWWTLKSWSKVWFSPRLFLRSECFACVLVGTPLIVMLPKLQWHPSPLHSV